MLLDKFVFLLLVASIAVAVPRPDDSDESKDDDDDICSQPALKPGAASCRAFLIRWTFNSKTKRCEQITYGGCKGTENLFDTEYACNAKCNRKALLRGPEASGSASAPSLCNLPAATGNCRAIVPSFYYDSASGTCKSFSYTGCKGNANNFITIDDCERTCRPKKAVAVTLPAPIQVDVSKGAKKKVNDVCNLPPIENTGRQCLAFIPSWTFDSKSGKCVSYVYGGCGKTANLFKTEADCQAKCGSSARTVQVATTSRDSCLLPVESGPCYAYFKRYAFIKDKNRCEIFVYGGCSGNANSFATADECFQTCGGELPSLTSECEHVSCPVSNKRYLDKGCRPVYKGKACCPTSFSCPNDKSSQGVCHYGGINYVIGQKIPAVSEDHPCKTECYCVSSVEHQDGATIKCSEMECPVTHEQTSKDCQVVTKPNKCCPSVECDDHSSEEKVAITCLFEGKEYNKGQSIPTGNPCKVCTCVDGFNGLNGPGCRETRCLIENRVGCVPIYTDDVCCPTSYKCAKSSAGVETQTRIIRVDGEPGKQGVETLPFMFPGGNYKKWQVKASFCLLPQEIGPCKMATPSFYYDGDQLQCLPFLYGGCEGNKNRFETEEQCYSTCQYSDAEIAASEPNQTGKELEIPKKDSSPFITTGIASTLPARVPAKDQDQKSPFITSGVASTLPARVPAKEEKKSPFITSGVASTLPARVPAKEEPKSPFITSGVASTLPARVSSSDMPSRCQQPKLIGPCRMSLEKFYFDTEQQDCRLFFYGGCKGNSNQFETVEECQQTCKPEVVVDKMENVETNVCELPQETGPCRGQVPSYFFNTNTGACESFWYGGCRGNGNRFETEVECQSRCVSNSSVATTVPSDSIPAHCNLPADMGPCRASNPRFHYNATAGQCQLFRFGGCRGNLNNFETIEQCQTECSAGVNQSPLLLTIQPEQEEKDVTCKLPADSGFCRAFQERFFYDSADNQCKIFSWGGCFGNANNFATSEECAAACGIKPAVAIDTARTTHARARARLDEPNQNEILVAVDPVCSFGNETLYLGDRIVSEDPCEECVCSTPPEITCVQHTCPSPPPLDKAICQRTVVPGKCCPDYSCVSANPPFIDVCADVVCQTGQHCEPTPQESADGSWMPPIGVCVADA